jgi:O-antigen/teichoic acid export membrane protein
MIPSLISRGLSLLLVPLYTRVLVPSDYGALDLLLVFGSLINLTIAFEVSQGVARYYPESHTSKDKILYASSAFWFTVICYTVFLIFALIFSSSLNIMIIGGQQYENAFRIGLVYLWLSGIFYLIQNQFRWELRSIDFAWVSLIMTILTSVASVCMVYFLKWGLIGTIYGMIFGSLAGCIYGMVKLKASFTFRFSKRHLKQMLLFSTPLVPAGFAAFLSSYIDRIMINHYLSLQEVGLYGIAFRLSSIINLIMIGFQGALTPLLYTYHKKETTPFQLSMIFRIFIFFSLIFFLTMTFYAQEIIIFITTPKYFEAAGLIKYLVPSILLLSMYIFAPGIGIAKKSSYIFFISISGAVVNTLLNFIFIPFFGTIGAALATLIASFFVFVNYMYFSQKFYYVPHDWKAIIIGVVGSFFLVSVSSFFDHGTTRDICFKGLLLIIGCTFFIKIGLLKKSEIRQAMTRASYLINKQ